MSDSTTLIDTIQSGQLQPELTANQYFDAASPATLFGRRGSATSLLTWAYYGGTMLVDGVLTDIANGTVTLTASATNYIEATRAGVVSKNTTGFTAGRIPLYVVTTNTTTVTSYTDERATWDPRYMAHKVSVSITSADVTLSAAQARARHIVLSGTLTGNRNLIVPDYGEWIVYNNTSGAFSVTVKTAAGTGDTVTQSSNRAFFADGTNVIATTAGTGNTAFGTIAVSGQSDVVADASSDTLTLVAGPGITITTNAGSDSVTITNIGSASNSFTTISVSGQSDVVADSGTDTLTLVAGSGMTITTNAGTDTITFASSGGGGGGVTVMSTVATTSGTTQLISGISSSAKITTFTLNGVSSNGTSGLGIRCGPSGGVATTGYGGGYGFIAGSGGSNTGSNSTYLVLGGTAGSDTHYGSVTFTLLDSGTNLYSWVGNFWRSGAAITQQGTITLSGVLERISVITVNGTDSLDAGSIGAAYIT